MVTSASAVVLAAGVGLVLWLAGAFADDHPDVPGCPDLAKSLPIAAGGTWAVSKPDPSRRLTRSSTSCELGFISADQRFSGTVSVLIVGNADDEVLRREVRDGPCNDDWTQPLDPQGAASGGYLAFKACDETVGDADFATVLAAKETRWVHMVATVKRRPGTHTEAAIFGRSLVRTVADQGLTIPASE